MNLEYIEDLVYKENINLINSRLEDTSGAYLNCENIKVIVLDKSKVKNSNEEKEILTEELAHYYCDATYKFNSDINFINKQEYRAHKWSYNVLVPYEDLKLAVKKRKQWFI